MLHYGSSSSTLAWGLQQNIVGLLFGCSKQYPLMSLHGQRVIKQTGRQEDAMTDLIIPLWTVVYPLLQFILINTYKKKYHTIQKHLFDFAEIIEGHTFLLNNRH